MDELKKRLKEIKEIDRDIHEPARLLILFILENVKECDFNFLLKETGLTKGNLSFHLYKLEEKGIIEIKKGFKDKKPRTIYRLTKKGKEEFKKYIERNKRIFRDVKF